MAKRLTPEEKLQREADKKAKREADRLARNAERQAQWAAQQQATRDAFQAGLTDHQKAAIAAILVPLKHEQDPRQPDGVLRPVYKNEFIGSLASQLTDRGFLSANQLSCIVRSYDRQLAEAKARETIIPIELGSTFETVIRFDSISIGYEDNGFGGTVLKATCRFVDKDGRRFKFSTGSEKSIAALRVQQETNEPLILKAKVKWIAPNGIITVLGGAGSQVRRLIE